jgi:hypothetical protein
VKHEKKKFEEQTPITGMVSTAKLCPAPRVFMVQVVFTLHIDITFILEHMHFSWRTARPADKSLGIIA